MRDEHYWIRATVRINRFEFLFLTVEKSDWKRHETISKVTIPFSNKFSTNIEGGKEEDR